MSCGSPSDVASHARCLRSFTSSTVPTSQLDIPLSFTPLLHSSGEIQHKGPTRCRRYDTFLIPPRYRGDTIPTRQKLAFALTLVNECLVLAQRGTVGLTDYLFAS